MDTQARIYGFNVANLAMTLNNMTNDIPYERKNKFEHLVRQTRQEYPTSVALGWG